MARAGSKFELMSDDSTVGTGCQHLLLVPFNLFPARALIKWKANASEEKERCGEGEYINEFLLGRRDAGFQAPGVLEQAQVCCSIQWTYSCSRFIFISVCWQ